jgi:hypothetical protein
MSAFDPKQTLVEINNPDAEIDHRIADFYAGIGREVVNAFCWERGQPTDWAELIAHTDRTWTPVLDYDEMALINAFPLPCAVSPGSRRWSVAAELLSQLIL